MKPTKLFFLLLFSIVVLQVTAQERHSTVKFWAPADRTARANALGLLEIDHFVTQDGAIVAEISHSKVQLLRQLGYRYEVLVHDVAENLQRVNQPFFEALRNGEVNIDGSSKTAARSAFEQPGSTAGAMFTTPTAFQVWSGANSLGGFYNFGQMETAMSNLVSTYSSIASRTSLGVTVGSRNVWVIKISDNVASDENEPEVLFIGVQHAREAIGGSSMIFMMQYLCQNYATDSRIRNLVDNREIFIIVCMNPDGWEYNRSTDPNGGGDWRKNREPNSGGSFGVDLNRNWGIDWGNCAGATTSCGTATQTADTYYGTGPFSERETQFVRDFTYSHHLSLMIDQHAYGPYYSLPFGRPTLHPGADSLTQMDQDFYTAVPALMGKYNGMRAGNSPQSVGYEVAGGVKDWMLKGNIGTGTKGKVFGMTGEGGFGTAIGTFWPPASQIVNLCKGILYQNLQLISAAGSYVDVQDYSPMVLTDKGGAIDLQVRRVGLSNEPVTITAQTIHNIGFNGGGTVTINSIPGYYDTVQVHLPYYLPGAMTDGQRLRFALRIQTGGQTWYDTITKYYRPDTLFAHNMDTGVVTNKWAVTGSWSYLADSGYNNTRALTESPNSSYPFSVGAGSSLARCRDTLVIPAATTGLYITFKTKHRAENFHDKLQLQVSTSVNGGAWSGFTAVNGKTTVREPGTAEGSTINGNPSLTGIRDDWATEVFDLTSFTPGSGTTRMVFRFEFTSDGIDDFWGAIDAGFLIDDIMAIRSSTPFTNLPLGVNFLDFSGALLASREVELKWDAVTDREHSYFIVERSTDQRNWSQVGIVYPNQPFRMIDPSPVKGNNYYRLKAVDINGAAQYSRVININIKSNFFQLSFFPNPVERDLTITVRTETPEKLHLQITDLAGRTVYTQDVTSVSNGRTIQIDTRSLAAQMYILKVVNSKNELLSADKFMKQ